MADSKVLEDDNISKVDLNIEKLQSKSHKALVPETCSVFNQTSNCLKNDNGEKIFKKTTVKSQKNRRKEKLNAKKVQEINNLEPKLDDENNDKVLNKNNVSNDTSTIKTQNKENKIKNSKLKVNSPSHKLTEYFADLTVNDLTNDKCKITDDLQQNQKVKDEKNSKTDILTIKQPLVKKSTQVNEKKQQRKPKSSTKSLNHTIDEYFKVRRSDRRFKKDIDLEKEKELQIKIIKQVEEGLEVREFESKGRGIVTTKEFCKGDFVIEYVGDLIDGATAKQRENQYAKNKNIGCYMYYFKHKNSQYCIDATEESGKLGRLINHSKKGNLMSRIIEVEKTPHLILFAKLDIPVGTEVLYDYGDRSKESVQHHPWLNL